MSSRSHFRSQYTESFLKLLSGKRVKPTLSIVSYQTAFANVTCAWALTYAARFGLNVSYAGSYGAPAGGLAGNWTPTVAPIVEQVFSCIFH